LTSADSYLYVFSIEQTFLINQMN